MAPKRRTNSGQVAVSIEVAVESADAFRALSKPFLDQIGRDLNLCHTLAAENLAGMIASVTSLALSVELYLKTLWLRNGQIADYTHDLLKLFKGLPPEARASVEKAYQSLEWPPAGVAIGLHLHIGARRFEGQSPRPKTVKDNSLIAVLGRCKDAFQTWRYLYQPGEVSQGLTFSYEFHCLDNAAEAIRRHVVADLMTQQEKMVNDGTGKAT